MATEQVCIAILAKDKAHCLPLYLQCIERQTYPKRQIRLYIRTNNNNDATVEVLEQWLARVKDQYAAVYFDASDVPEPVQRFAPHEWNIERFKVLGAIRQASIEYAREHGSHYFVADVDNYIIPSAIEDMVATHLPVIGPMLHRAVGNTSYSNYHLDVDANGYYKDHPHYYTLLRREVVGIFEVPVIHCSYLIRNEVLSYVSYDDGSGRYEYVVFSDSLRKAGVPQYLDNRRGWGYLTFADTKQELEAEPWYATFGQ